MVSAVTIKTQIVIKKPQFEIYPATKFYASQYIIFCHVKLVCENISLSFKKKNVKVVLFKINLSYEKAVSSLMNKLVS